MIIDREQLNALYNTHLAQKFPRLGYIIPEYVLYDSYIFGLFARLLKNATIEENELPGILHIDKIEYNKEKYGDAFIEMMIHYKRLLKMRKIIYGYYKNSKIIN